MNTTPSVYATKSGGGFGDGGLTIRGFESRNIAVMVNGMPVNDMEGGAVYFSKLDWIIRCNKYITGSERFRFF